MRARNCNQGPSVGQAVAKDEDWPVCRAKINEEKAKHKEKKAREELKKAMLKEGAKILT